MPPKKSEPAKKAAVSAETISKVKKLDKNNIIRTLQSASHDFDSTNLPSPADIPPGTPSCPAPNQCKKAYPRVSISKTQTSSVAGPSNQSEASDIFLLEKNLSDDEYFLEGEELEAEDRKYDKTASTLIDQSRGVIMRKASDILEETRRVRTNSVKLPSSNLKMADVNTFMDWITAQTGVKFSIQQGLSGDFSVSVTPHIGPSSSPHPQPSNPPPPHSSHPRPGKNNFTTPSYKAQILQTFL